MSSEGSPTRRRRGRPVGPAITDTEILDAARSLGIPPGEPIAVVWVAAACVCSVDTVKRRLPQLRARGLWPWIDGRYRSPGRVRSIRRALQSRAQSGRTLAGLGRDLHVTPSFLRKLME